MIYPILGLFIHVVTTINCHDHFVVANAAGSGSALNYEFRSVYHYFLFHVGTIIVPFYPRYRLFSVAERTGLTCRFYVCRVYKSYWISYGINTSIAFTVDARSVLFCRNPSLIILPSINSIASLENRRKASVLLYLRC